MTRQRLHQLIILLTITFFYYACSGTDFSSDEKAISYMASYDFVQTQKFDANSLDAIKKALKDFPERDNSFINNEYAACFSHLETLKQHNIIIHKKNYIKGAADSIAGVKPVLDARRVMIIRDNYNNIMSSKKVITTEEFEKQLKYDSTIRRTISGLYYKIIKDGEGQSPVISSRVTVNMTGKLPNGFIITNTRTKLTPVQFYIKATIKGMAEGLCMMKKGGHYIFYIPPKLGYENMQKGQIPPNSYLIFDIELLDIQKK